MDLMKGSTSMALLVKKYSGFASPTVHIRVDGKDLADKLGAGLSEITVDLSCEYPASGCGFDVVGAWDPAKSAFAPAIARTLQLGAKVELELGYIATECVFCGLITAVNYVFDNETAPFLHVDCMDAKCLLMKMQRLEVRSERDVGRLASALLGEPPVSTYLTGKSVLVPGAQAEQLHMGMESDFDYLVHQAEYLGCEFFIQAGRAYFRSPPPAAPAILTLSPDGGLYTASLALQAAPLVKTVTVAGIDPESDKRLSASASLKGRFGSGAGPQRMLGGTERAYYDSRVLSAAQAQKRADILLSGIQRQFGQLQASCRGLPELVPGRTLRLHGLGASMDRSYYLTRVRHTLNDSGFTTALEARIDSL